MSDALFVYWLILTAQRAFFGSGAMANLSLFKKKFTSAMTEGLPVKAPNPWVFFDISIGGKAAGTLIFELRQDLVPMASENFRCLCSGKMEKKSVNKSLGKRLHFKGTRFHRILPGVMLQGGDVIRGDGTAGESIYGDTFEDENFLLRHTGPGVLSMANSGPDSNSSRFFLSTAKTEWLDEKHVVFGYVLQGHDVLRKMEAEGNPVTGAPRVPVVIEDCGECTVNRFTYLQETDIVRLGEKPPGMG